MRMLQAAPTHMHRHMHARSADAKKAPSESAPPPHVLAAQERLALASGLGCRVIEWVFEGRQHASGEPRSMQAHAGCRVLDHKRHLRAGNNACRAPQSMQAHGGE